MMRSFRSLFAVTLILAWAWCASAMDPAPQSPEGLQTRAMRMFAEMPFPGVVPMAPNPDGEPRFSILKFLADNGVETPPGAEAIWLPKSKVLVATLLPKDHELMTRILDVPCWGFSVKTMQLTLSVWEYEDGRPAANAQPTTFKELAERAGDSLRLLHSQTLRAKSGNRVTGTSRQGDAGLLGKDAAASSPGGRAEDPLPALGLAHGSVVRFEPVVSPDGISIDLAAEYVVRAPSSQAGVDVEVSGNQLLTVVAGSEAVLQSAGLRMVDEKVPNGKVRRYAVVVGGAIDESQDKLKANVEQQLKKNAVQWEKEMSQKAKGK